MSEWGLQSGAWSGAINTQIFLCPPTHSWVKKCHWLTLNAKLGLQLTIQMALVRDISLMTKKCVCTVKDFKNSSKSINQIRPVLLPWWNIWGVGGLKNGVFSPQDKLLTSYGCEARRSGRVFSLSLYFQIITETLKWIFFGKFANTFILLQRTKKIIWNLVWFNILKAPKMGNIGFAHGEGKSYVLGVLLLKKLRFKFCFRCNL